MNEDDVDVLEEWRKILYPHSSSSHKKQLQQSEPSSTDVELKQKLTEHEKFVEDIAIQTLSQKYGPEYAQALVQLAKKFKPIIVAYIFKIRPYTYKVKDVLEKSELSPLNEAYELLYGKVQPGMIVLFNDFPGKFIVFVTDYQVRLGKKVLPNGQLSQYVKAFKYICDQTELDDYISKIKQALEEIQVLKQKDLRVVSRDFMYLGSSLSVDAFCGVKDYNSGFFENLRNKECLWFKDKSSALQFYHQNLQILGQNIGSTELRDELVKLLERKAQSIKPDVKKPIQEDVEFKISHSKLLRNIFLVSVPSRDVSFYAEIVEIDYELYSYYFYGRPQDEDLFSTFSRRFPPKALLKMIFGDSKNES
ncbi:MAG: hypothetical protein ACP5IT_07895 [Thermoproteota archaeon]